MHSTGVMIRIMIMIRHRDDRPPRRLLHAIGDAPVARSYGFRPDRSAHQALQKLHTGFMRHGLRWVIDLDIENYFGSIEVAPEIWAAG
jgi:hypothetical protein